MSRLLTELGWTDGSQIDLGGLETARGQEHFTQMYFAPTTSVGHDTFNIAVVTKRRRAGPGRFDPTERSDR